MCAADTPLPGPPYESNSPLRMHSSIKNGERPVYCAACSMRRPRGCNEGEVPLVFAASRDVVFFEDKPGPPTGWMEAGTCLLTPSLAKVLQRKDGSRHSPLP